MYKQLIDKAVVMIIRTDNMYGEVRIYAPYTGRLTENKREALDQRVNRYIKDRSINVVKVLSWKTKDIVITRPDKGDIDQRETYKEDGASGCLMPNSIYVCAEQY